MKAIPTTYDGIEFRSRLEARWQYFFDKLGVMAVYEPFEISNNGLSYVPDFYAVNLCWNPVIIEIKPVKPKSEYIDYLRKIRDPSKAEFYILVGDPSFDQPSGVVIYGHGNYVVEDFLLTTCSRCGYYAMDYSGVNLCACSFMPPSKNWKQASEKAKEFRFDL